MKYKKERLLKMKNRILTQNYFMSLKFLYASLILFLTACSSGTEPKELETSAEDTVEFDVTAEGISFMRDTLNYVGYIGDAVVTVQLVLFNTEQEVNFLDSMYGTYSYDVHKKDIHLSGVYRCEDNCIMSLVEKLKGKTTGKWELKVYDYKSDLIGTWSDPVTKKKEFIVLKNIASDNYLDVKSKAVFTSEKASQNFFNKHQVYKNDMRNKRFYLLANKTSQDEYFSYDNEKQYEYPIPVGLKFHFDWEEAYGESQAVMTKDSRLKGKNGLNIPFDSLFPMRVEIGYEVVTCVFNVVSPTEITSNGHKGSGFTINIADVEKLGYHLVDEIEWLIGSSDKVLGFFPNSETILTIHQKPDAKSKVAIKVDPDSMDAHIVVRGAKLIGTEWWAEVDYEYYDVIPCSSDEVVPLATVKGWVKLYNEKGDVVLSHYSRGC